MDSGVVEASHVGIRVTAVPSGKQVADVMARDTIAIFETVR